ICWSRCDSRRLTGSGRRRRYQNPPFSVATILCDVGHFFPVATRLPCGRLAHNVRLTCTANSNPKENDHGSSRRQRSEHAASAAGLSAAAGTERRRQETGRRAEGVPAGTARTPVESEAPVELAGERPAKNRQGQTGANHRLVTRLVGRVRSWGLRRLRI